MSERWTCEPHDGADIPTLKGKRTREWVERAQTRRGMAVPFEVPIHVGERIADLAGCRQIVTTVTPQGAFRRKRGLRRLAIRMIKLLTPEERVLLSFASTIMCMWSR